MEKDYSVSVIIPVYNEINLLEASVYKIDNFLKSNFRDYEIIIIESGSNDGTAKKCDESAASLTDVKLIHEGSRNGFGSALKLGYRHATKDLIWLVTVDLPFPLESILLALPLLSKYDYILSYRSKDNRQLMRKIQSFVYNVIVKFSLGLKQKHVNSAFKVFKRNIVKDLNLISNSWIIEAEIIYRLKNKNVSYAEIPIPLINRTQGRSSIRGLDFISVFKELVFFVRMKDNL